MRNFSSVILFLVILPASLGSVRASSVQFNKVHSNMSCTLYQTACGSGCCPYADAVCCADGFECCQHGQICIPWVGICIGTDSEENDKPSLVSTKATPIQNKVTACPSYTTPCGEERCCPLPNAVCCSDGEHCCPAGYSCDIEHGRCIKDSNELFNPFLKTGLKQFKTINESPFKPCPGGTRQCPSHTSCCLNDSGNWSCCPNPSLNMYRNGVGGCCYTILGPMCCPGGFSKCTFFGCTG